MALVPYKRSNQDLFDEFFFSFPMFAPRNTDMRPARPHCGMLKCDVREDDKEYEIRADFPGVAREDIDVTYDQKSGVLTISYEHKDEKNDKDEDGKWTIRERSFCSQKRQFSCPDADPDVISATLTDGVLAVKVGKTDKAEDDSKKVIEIG